MQNKLTPQVAAVSACAHNYVHCAAKMVEAIETTHNINSVSSGADFDALFIPGGHGVVYDMVDNQELQDVISDAFDAGKVVASVCHGPAAFAKVNSKKTGKPIVEGKQVCMSCRLAESCMQLQVCTRW